MPVQFASLQVISRIRTEFDSTASSPARFSAKQAAISNETKSINNKKNKTIDQKHKKIKGKQNKS